MTTSTWPLGFIPGTIAGVNQMELKPDRCYFTFFKKFGDHKATRDNPNMVLIELADSTRSLLKEFPEDSFAGKFIEEVIFPMCKEFRGDE